MTQRKIIFPVLLCFLLAGCSLFGSDDKSNKEKLELNRHTWQKQNISSYQFNLFVGCFCSFKANPVIIVVRDDTVSTVLDPKTGKMLRFPHSNQPATEKYEDYPTVDELFETIEHAIKRDAYHLEVNYNPIYGYPLQIKVNYGKNVADDFVNYQVSDFKIATQVR